jgi:glutathione S-transferase
MKYLTIAEGRAARGLRLVLSAGVPGPWGEAAKAVLKLRGVPYAPVAQEAMGPNEELVAWTGIRNAPIAVLDDDPPLTGWLDMVLLAERLGSGPSLLPAHSAERALCLGMITEIASPQGLAWNCRLWMIVQFYGAEPTPETPAHQRSLMKQYGLSAPAVAAAPGRAVDILRGLAAQLHAERARGSDYFVGAQLSALDVYWACFSQMIAPLPESASPMPDYVRAVYSTPPAAVAAALDPILLEHRDRVFERHIGLPLEY